MSDDSRFITGVRIWNYRSIEYCDVELRPLTLLVGPNGSGKSNFLDALRFLRDSLNPDLDHAFRVRNGPREVVRRAPQPLDQFAIDVRFRLPDQTTGEYSVTIGVRENAF